MEVIDLFAGTGGWEVGLQYLCEDTASPHIYSVGIENDKAANLTRAEAGHLTLDRDITTIDPLRVLTDSPDLFPSQRLDGLIASPPCTDWSAAGKRKELAGTTGGLIFEPIRFVEELEPTWIAFEQVPPALRMWQHFAKDILEPLGYYTWTGMLHAEQYGVPQTRKRAFLLAHRDYQPEPPIPTHSRYYPRNPDKYDPGVMPWVSMAEALDWDLNGDEFAIRSNYGTGGDPQNRGVRPGTAPSATITSKADRNKIVPWPYHRPSTTIVGSFRPDIVAAPGYRKAGDGPRQNAPGSVSITIEDALRLQSFPSDYPVQGGKAKQFQQVGNAVPPLLAECVLASLLQIDI